MKDHKEVEQGFVLVDAIRDFVAKSKGKIRVGDKFALSVANFDAVVADSGKVERVKLCNATVTIYSQTNFGLETKPRRRLPQEDVVFIPRNMILDGRCDFANLSVEVTTRGYIISRTSRTTAWLRLNN